MSKKRLFLVALILSCNLGIYAQGISLRLRNVTVAKAMTELRKKTGYSFVYEGSDLNTRQRVNVDAKDLRQAADQILGSQNVTYTIQGKNIVVSAKNEQSQGQARPQNTVKKTNGRRTVKGHVTDENGEPIIGASVTIANKKGGTITDSNGYYTLEADRGDIISISYVGFKDQSQRLGHSDNMDFTMSEDINNLNELVVVGYGVQKKSDIISSVASVKSEEMNKNVTLDLGEMLRGQVAGMQVSTSSAAPGGSSSIQIRGVNSISGGTSPIIVCDGVVLGNINNINPNDIASVEILKDAAAQAIYGARAANGVILVTTKRGKSGKARIEYNGYFGIQNVIRNFETYSPEEFVQYKREAYRTTNGNTYGEDNEVFSQLELESIKNQRYIDWQKELMRTGTIQSHNISLTTGNDQTRVYVSGNYENQQGIVRLTNFQKATLRANIDQKVSHNLSVGANILLSISEGKNPSSSTVFRNAVICSPLGQVYDENGDLIAHPTGLQENWNPLLDLMYRNITTKNRNDLVDLFFDWKIFKNLNYRLSLSRRSWNQKMEMYSNSKSQSGSYTGTGTAVVNNQDNYEWTLDNILTYKNSFGKNNVEATLLQSWSGAGAYVNGMTGSLIPNDMLGIYGMPAADKIVPNLSGSKRKLISTALRLVYNFDNRYYLQGSVRRDGSSVFGENNKWGVFPSIAAGWNIYQEKFMKNVNFITNLKLRVSYGSVGNEAISPYGSIASADEWDYLTSSRQIGYTPGNQLSNPNLKWETTTTLNLALDYGFFNNRLNGSIEWYATKTKDLLVNRSINSSTGYTNMRDNIGEIQNHGIEASINGMPLKLHNFTIEAGIIYSMNRNKITKLFGDKDGDGKEDDYPQNNWYIGKPISVYRLYRAVGIWQEGQEDEISKSAQPNATPGSVRLWDNGDGKLTIDDQSIVSRYPKWNGTFYLRARFKNVDFSATLYTVQGVKRLNPYLYDYSYGGNMRAVFNGIKVNYWTPENPTGSFPRPTTNGQEDMQWLALEDASYWRLTNMQIGYSLPNKVIAPLHVDKLRMYATAQNLFTITDFHSYSPEQDADQYPNARSFIIGVQLSF